ncbi:MAG: hypothetical protein AMXMBFR23_02000 [Chloroflexota bacterium]
MRGDPPHRLRTPRNDHEALRARVGAATGQEASGLEFLPFADVAESVREDLALLRAGPLLPADYELLGYDVATGRLEPITESCR